MQSSKCRVQSENEDVRNEPNRLRTLRRGARAERTQTSARRAGFSLHGLSFSKSKPAPGARVRNEPILLHGVAWRCTTLHGVAFRTCQCAKRTHWRTDDS